MKLKILYFIACAVLVTGCLKDNSCATTYVLKPMVQAKSVDQPTPMADGVLVYTHHADTLLWTVASYEDAVAGVITSKENPAEQITTPAAIGTPYQYSGTSADGSPFESVGWLQMPIAQRPQMVVAVNTRDSLFAYTMQEAVLNVPYFYISLVFTPFKEGRSYKTGKWMMRNDFYNPPVKLKAYVDPTYQKTEAEGMEHYLNNELKVYAFAADTTEWRIKSYEDALAQRITLKRDSLQQHDEPNFVAYREQDGRFGMTINTSPLMIVVVDRTNKLYAYTKQTPDLHGAEPTWEVVMRLWLEDWIREENGWVIVNDRFSPENQKPEPEPEPEPDPEVPAPSPEEGGEDENPDQSTDQGTDNQQNA